MKPQDSIHGGRVRWPHGLGAFNDYRAVWFEITKSEHGHGGPGWEYGRYLWCPVRNRGGARYRRIMEEPCAGDLVIHIYEHWWPDGKKEKRLHGASLVASGAQVIHEEPPEPGEWGGMAPYYRIALRGFREFENPVSLPEFIAAYGERVISEIWRGSTPSHYPFLDPGTGEPRLIQGLYLARCTEDLFLGIRQAVEGTRHARPESTADKPLDIEPDRRGSIMDDLKHSPLLDKDRLEEILEAITKLSPEEKLALIQEQLLPDIASDDDAARAVAQVLFEARMSAQAHRLTEEERNKLEEKLKAAEQRAEEYRVLYRKAIEEVKDIQRRLGQDSRARDRAAKLARRFLEQVDGKPVSTVTAPRQKGNSARFFWQKAEYSLDGATWYEAPDHMKSQAPAARCANFFGLTASAFTDKVAALYGQDPVEVLVVAGEYSAPGYAHRRLREWEGDFVIRLSGWHQYDGPTAEEVEEARQGTQGQMAETD